MNPVYLAPSDSGLCPFADMTNVQTWETTARGSGGGVKDLSQWPSPTLTRLPKLREVTGHRTPLVSVSEKPCIGMGWIPSFKLMDLKTWALSALVLGELALEYTDRAKQKCFCCSVAKSCRTLSDPMDCSTAGFPCPSLSPGVCLNLYPLSWWCY